MKNLEIYIFKALTGNMSKADFEKKLYKSCYVNRIAEDKFIANLMDINYSLESWKYNLERVAQPYYGNKTFLVNMIRFYCKRIVNDANTTDIKEIVYDLSIYHDKNDFKFKTLFHFQAFYNAIDTHKYDHRSPSESDIFKKIKAFAEYYLEQQEKGIEDDELLNLSDPKGKN